MKHASIEELRLELESEYKELSELAATGIASIDALDLRQLRQAVLLTSNPRLSKSYKVRVRALSRMDDIEITLKFLDDVKQRHLFTSVIFTESGVLGEMESGKVSMHLVDTKENFTDVGGEDATWQKAGETFSDAGGQEEKLDIQKFFERPVPITTFQVPVAGTVSLALSVWDLVTLNPSIRAKLRNYAYLRANLNVRVAISGTPFHYGRLLVSYQPIPASNATLTSLNTNMGFDTGYRPLLLNYLSQAPGAVTMDVRDNKPMDLQCPYIAPKPMFRLYRGTTAIGASTSFPDIEEAGDLYIYTINPVGCVSSTPSDVSVYVYAWLTEVELGTSTGTQIAITTESGKPDERDIGPVEHFSTRAARFAGSLISVPYIGSYAVASEMAFSTLGKISSLFGWSKPIMLNEPHLVKNVAFQNGAQIIGYDTNYKISLDPKQELTVDPSVLGDGIDEMSIKYLASIESYLTTFTWNDDSAVLTPIWLCGVTPQLYTNYADTAVTAMSPTPMAFVSECFRYWRGTIKFRIDIVCSQFHRGKLMVFFEPNSEANIIINTALSTNKQYAKVLDIQETQSIEFCVEWAAGREWQATIQPEAATTVYGTTFSGLRNNFNGYIGIAPLTTLQSPDDSDIQVNVFVSCEDLEVNFLSSAYLATLRSVATESGPIIDKDVTCMSLNESTADDAHIAEIYFGERPISFRGLLKRYVHSATASLSADVTTQKNAVFTFPIIPEIQTQYATGTTTFDDQINLFNHLRYAYLGIRGGIRKRIQIFGYDHENYLSQAKITLGDITSYASPSAAYSATYKSSDLRGTVTMVPSCNAGIEVELPFYTNNTFLVSFADDLVGENTAQTVYNAWPSMYEVAVEIIGGNEDIVAVEESAAAEDFMFMRFQGTPYRTFVP